MAATGILLVLFLFAHMAGNVKIFFGPGAFDHYAHWLRTIGSPLVPDLWYLWIQRTVLTVAVLGHIAAATILARRARRARPVRYAHRPKVQGSYAARTMRWGGVIILLFVIYHILDLTVGAANPDFRPGNVYHNVLADFRRWYVTAIYTVAVLAVGLHLRHGVWSAARSLGGRLPQGLATGVAIAVTAGFLAVPFSVQLGLVR
jgi:succinate dehydrogenase / fumarate reductase, cytochrome b subunit